MEEKKRIFVGNLPAGVRLRDIRQMFMSCGRVLDIYLDRANSRYAFVQYEDARDARVAVRRLDGEKLLGTRITVQMTRSDGKRKSANPESSVSSMRRDIGDEDAYDDRRYDEDVPAFQNIIDQPQNYRVDSPVDFMPAPPLHIPPSMIPQQQNYQGVREERTAAAVEPFFPVPEIMMSPQVYHHTATDFSYPPIAVDDMMDRYDDIPAPSHHRRPQQQPHANLNYDHRRHQQDIDLRRSQDDVSPCPPSPLPPNREQRQVSSVATVSTATAGSKRKRSEEPEIYDVSKETKQENPSLTRWMNYCKTLAERLDKMGEKQQAYARMKIEEAMYQAEFGPYSSSGSSGSQPTGACTGTLYPVGFIQQ